MAEVDRGDASNSIVATTDGNAGASPSPPTTLTWKRVALLVMICGEISSLQHNREELAVADFVTRSERGGVERRVAVYNIGDSLNALCATTCY